MRAAACIAKLPIATARPRYRRPHLSFEFIPTPSSSPRFGASERHVEAEPYAAPLCEYARVVQRPPVQHVVAVRVLQVGAAGAAGLGVVDLVVVARGVH